MPQGMFLLIDDPVNGLEIKCEYSKNPIEIQPKFLATLFSSHAEIEKESFLEASYENFKIVSYAPRYIATRNTKAGVLGVILDYHETLNNLELFLRRNLLKILKKPDNETMIKIFEVNLQRYMLVNYIFDRIQIENIAEILIIKGNRNYQSTILWLGERELSKLDIAILYKRIQKKSKIPMIRYYKMKTILSNIYLIVKCIRFENEIDKIFTTIVQYLKKNFNYSLEILALFLLAPIINLTSSKEELHRDIPDKKDSLLKVLLKSKDYSSDFNQLISSLVKGDSYLSSTINNE